MSEVLNILQKPIYDESIIKKEYHSYTSYLQSFKNNDEIRISIQNQDLYVLPSDSYIYIEGFVTLENGTISRNIKLKNNCVAFLFDEIRYEMNGIEVDRTRYLGITSSLKNYVSLNNNESKMLKNAGWFANSEFELENGYFNFCVPLKMLLGFAEDFNKIILNSKHELILLRSKSDQDAFFSTDAKEKIQLNIINITWKIPHIQLADFSKLEILKTINSERRLTLAFRSWDCHFNPVLSQGLHHLWNVKLSPQSERPRFILIVFQTSSGFQHCDLTNIKVHLNSDSYPYDDLNLKFDRNRFAILYEMYIKFQQSYYMREPQPLLSREDFKKVAPVIVIDVTHQNESIKLGPIDIRVEFQTAKNIPENTSAYCLLIHDRIIEYSPLTGEVKRVV